MRQPPGLTTRDASAMRRDACKHVFETIYTESACSAGQTRRRTETLTMPSWVCWARAPASTEKHAISCRGQPHEPASRPKARKRIRARLAMARDLDSIFEGGLPVFTRPACVGTEADFVWPGDYVMRMDIEATCFVTRAKRPRAGEPRFTTSSMQALCPVCSVNYTWCTPIP